MTDAKAVAACQAATALETAPTRYIEGGGIRFAYRHLGPAGGTPMILLQHFSGNIDAWDPAVVNALAADRPVIAFDTTQGSVARPARRPTTSRRCPGTRSRSSTSSASPK